MSLIRVLIVSLLLIVPAAAQDILTGGATAEEPQASTAAVEDLVRILEDDTARAALIEKLKAAAPTAEDADAAPGPASELSIARQLAEYTRSVAEGASASMRSIGTVLSNLQGIFSGSLSADGAALREFATNIGLLILALFGSFFVLRLIANALGRGLSARLAGRGVAARLSGLLGLAFVDVASILLAWGLGYALALNFGTMPGGTMGINQSLLLN